MKKILVATDYSKEARHALLFAMGLAHQSKAEIMLFHAFNQPIAITNAFYLEKAISDLEDEKTELLEEYLRERVPSAEDFVLHFITSREASIIEKSTSELTPKGFHTVKNKALTKEFPVTITCVCKFGLPEETIPVAAETYGADLVIMGMRGAGALSQAFLGSTVSAVMQTGKVPVLALPLKATIKNYATFVFACDLQLLPDLAMLERLQELVKLFRANLKILHLYHGHNAQQEHENVKPALDKLDVGLYDISFDVYFQNSRDIARGIQNFILTQPADVLALIPKHHSFLEILLKDTITGIMTEQAAIPLLTFPFATHIEKVEITNLDSVREPTE